MELNRSCAQYVGMINGKIVCHAGVIQFPMRKGWKRVHRLVVLPDYQGIGIGTRFIEEIAKMYIEEGYTLNLTTTTPALVNSLRKNPKWCLIRYGRNTSSYDSFVKAYGNKSAKHLRNVESNHRVTYSFNYEGGKR